MFDIGWSELLVVAVVAIVVIGPRDLPTAMRTLGRALGGVRRMAADFRSQFDDAMREAELDDLRREITSLRDVARGIVQQNDVAAIAQGELSQIQTSLESKEAVLEAKEAEVAAEEHPEVATLADEGDVAALPAADTAAVDAYADAAAAPPAYEAGAAEAIEPPPAPVPHEAAVPAAEIPAPDPHLHAPADAAAVSNGHRAADPQGIAAAPAEPELPLPDRRAENAERPVNGG